MIGVDDMKRIVPYAHEQIKLVVTQNDVVIDATCGNGQDALFLSKISHKVYSFDIQEKALKEAKKRNKGQDNIVYILDGHENMNRYVKEPVKAVVFNLGYLPGGDQSITTTLSSTLQAIKTSLTLLSETGIISITLYPGHAEGKKEAIEVTKMIRKLPASEYNVLLYQFINKHDAPFNLLIKKIR